MYRELERLAELYGVRDADIPAFITAVKSIFTAHAQVIEDWHGKANNGCM